VPDKTPKSILSYLRPHRRALGLGVLLLLATNALDKAIPWLLAYAVDALREGRLAAVGEYAIWVIAIAVLSMMVYDYWDDCVKEKHNGASK